MDTPNNNTNDPTTIADKPYNMFPITQSTSTIRSSVSSLTFLGAIFHHLIGMSYIGFCFRRNKIIAHQTRATLFFHSDCMSRFSTHAGVINIPFSATTRQHAARHHQRTSDTNHKCCSSELKKVVERRGFIPYSHHLARTPTHSRVDWRQSRKNQLAPSAHALPQFTSAPPDPHLQAAAIDYPPPPHPNPGIAPRCQRHTSTRGSDRSPTDQGSSIRAGLRLAARVWAGRKT